MTIAARKDAHDIGALLCDTCGAAVMPSGINPEPAHFRADAADPYNAPLCDGDAY